MDYSLDAYRAILVRAAVRGATFAPFTAGAEQWRPTGPCIYLRHDVDFSLGMAVQLAEANVEVGALGTFFVLLRSPVYNLLSYDALPYLLRISELGQRLGLHVAVPDPLPRTDHELADLVLADFETARRHVPQLDPVFAWHNTTPPLLERGLGLVVPGLVNAYAAPLFKDIPYRSDTGMRYATTEWLSIVAEQHDAMQLLFHPELWIGGGQTVAGALARTWPQVLRERESEFRRNRLYGAQFPDGMPASVTDSMVRALVRHLPETSPSVAD